MYSKLHSTLLSTTLNARQLFSFYSNTPWSMLLDSGNSQHVDANFDIIVHSPTVTLLSDDEKTTISYLDDNSLKYSVQNPFDVLQEELNSLGLSDQVSNLPFSGGALGLFAYDLGRHCEKLKKESVKDLDAPTMAVGLYKHAIVFDKRNNTCSVVSRSNEVEHNQYLQKLYKMLSTNIQGSQFLAGEHWRFQLTKAQYLDKFNQVQNHLKQGNCYQVNLTQRFELPYKGNEYIAYLELVKNNETPFSGFIRLDDCAIMSLSPERFLQTQQNHIQTKPIKGTIARSPDKVEDDRLAKQLLTSEKDRSENLMIVDLLRNDIARNAKAGSVDVPHLFQIESFENVHHLVSTITATLPDDVTPLQLLRDAFPGGSITGAPKISAMNIIDSLEPNRRSIYCGSIGYISADGNMDTSITIRTLLATNQTIYAWAGGGIVADSTVDAEYQECLDKLSSIMPLLTNLEINA